MKARLTVFLLISFLFTNVAFAKSIGRVTKMKGEIFRSNVENQVIRQPLSVGESIEEGDIIESEKRSFMKVLMKDDTIFSIGPSTKFAFEQFKMKTKNERTATYNLLKGKLRSVFTKKAPKKTLTIKTPSAAMGVRGTEIVSDVYKFKGKLRTDIALIHGKLEVLTKQGKKFDLKPSEIFEAVDTKRKDIKQAAKVLKGRKVASSQIQASKRKLKKKVFETLRKKPRKGGEVFLFDALKSERKDVSKGAEFHSVTDENKVRLNVSKKEKDRLSIFSEQKEKRTYDDVGLERGNKKDKDNKDAKNKKNEKRPQAAIKKETFNNKDMKGSSQDDFDFTPNILAKDKKKPLLKKEARRQEFFQVKQDRGPASVGNGNGPKVKRVNGSKDFKAPKIEVQAIDRKDVPKRKIKVNRSQFKSRLEKGFNKNPNARREIQGRIKRNMQRQVVNERLQRATGNRIPASKNDVLKKQIDRQKQMEQEKLRLIELQKQKLIEEQKRKALEDLKNRRESGTIDTLK